MSSFDDAWLADHARWVDGTWYVALPDVERVMATRLREAMANAWTMGTSALANAHPSHWRTIMNGNPYRKASE